MTALGRRWMRNPSVLQLRNHSMATDCTTKAVPLLTVRVKSKLQGKIGGVRVCHLIIQSPETLSLCVCVCVKQVIRPPVQTALSANNNGYFLLLSLPLSAQRLCPGLLADRCAEITPSNCF